MGLTEILEIIMLILLIGVGALIVITDRRRAAGQGGTLSADEAEAMIRAEVQRAEAALLGEVRREVAGVRTDLLAEIRASRTETVDTVQKSVDRLGGGLRESQKAVNDAQNARIDLLSDTLDKRMKDLTAAQDKRMNDLSGTLDTRIAGLTASQTERMTTLTVTQDKRQASMQNAVMTLLNEKTDALTSVVTARLENVEKQFTAFSQQSRESQESTRRTVEERLSAMQKDNGEQLEKMRATVDEKLQKTLDERISQSFQLVNERLTEVYQGLGEMKMLAGSVGDLKKVLSGVKTRGILGEIQLGAIVEDMLTPEQYDKNVVTKPGTSNPVEFAVKLPGDGSGTVYLPIDSKFPGDTYAHLMDAYESADPNAVKEAQKALRLTVLSEGKDIADKYIDPPHTTSFGVMFLPVEGLYAEVVRMGLAEELRQKYQITVAGPTTLAALLNSLQMGFRTLAIQKRSGEVWQVLGAVKTEFGSFEKVLTLAQQRIEQTGAELDKLVGVRTRQINRKLKTVSELPADETALLLDGVDGGPTDVGE